MFIDLILVSSFVNLNNYDIIIVVFFVARPLVVVFPPAIVGDFCGNGNITYDVRLVFQVSVS